MKSALKKFFNTASADNKEGAETMATKEGQTEMAAENKTAELQALLESATTTLSATQSKLSEMTALYESAKSSLKGFEDANAALVAEANQKRLDARRAKVEASVGTSKAPALLAATESLDDAAFEAIVSAMSTNLDAEASTESFKEVGSSAPEDKTLYVPVKEGEETLEAKNLKAKYQSNKGNK